MFYRKTLTSVMCLSFLLGAGVSYAAETKQASSTANACECPPMEETDEAFNNSDLVLVGKVTDVQGSVIDNKHLEITFRIRKLLKANSAITTHEVVVYVPKGKCKYDFKYNTDYIVYAKGDLFFYRTDICARNKLFDVSFDELERLKKLDTKNSQSSTSSPPTDDTDSTTSSSVANKPKNQSTKDIFEKLIPEKQPEPASATEPETEKGWIKIGPLGLD